MVLQSEFDLYEHAAALAIIWRRAKLLDIHYLHSPQARKNCEICETLRGGRLQEEAICVRQAYEITDLASVEKHWRYDGKWIDLTLLPVKNPTYL